MWLYFLQQASTDNSSFFSKYLHARLLTLRGTCFYETNQLNQALECFYKSCNLISFDFPRLWWIFLAFVSRSQTFFLSSKLTTKSKLKILKANIRKSLNEKALPTKLSKLSDLTISLISENLRLASRIFSSIQHFELAKLAAFWGLAGLLKIKSNCIDLAEHFAIIFEIILNTNEVESFEWLLRPAIIRITRQIFSQEITADVLISISKMYKSLMMWK